jgi:2-polyprenyl-3-methyl-5-hydroxy-6-metoxy-1,4-benzoquinol methylase
MDVRVLSEGEGTMDGELDVARAQRFAARMLSALNGAALALMTSVGHRTGLFDVLRDRPPATAAEIAAQAGLDERYVREWLGAMTVAGVVDYDPGAASFRLPAEHAALLTRAAHPSNLAATFQWIPLLGAVEDEIVRCFAHGGGVPPASYRRLAAVMAENSDQAVVARLLDDIVPLVPGLAEQLRAGADVLDVGCGSGRALARLAEAFPRSRFVGVDICERAIEAARAQARTLGLRNLAFELHDAALPCGSDRFDLVTAFDAIHDQAAPSAVLANVAALLRPEGVFLMQDIAGTSALEADAANPLATFLYTLSCLHCTTVSLAAGGAGLGAMWGERRARRMLAEAGFAAVAVHSLPRDPVSLYYVARKAAA